MIFNIDNIVEEIEKSLNHDNPENRNNIEINKNNFKNEDLLKKKKENKKDDKTNKNYFEENIVNSEKLIKKNIGNKNYSVNYSAARIKNYFKESISYVKKIIRERQDFTKHVPNKALNLIPSYVVAAGLLGYTYLGAGAIHRGSQYDLQDKSYMVDVHECIHTNDEYETRILTEWMLEESN